MRSVSEQAIIPTTATVSSASTRKSAVDTNTETTIITKTKNNEKAPQGIGEL